MSAVFLPETVDNNHTVSKRFNSKNETIKRKVKQQTARQIRIHLISRLTITNYITVEQ